MRALLADAVLAIGGSFAASLLVKATLTLGLALIASRLAQRSRAAVRHVVLAVAFAMLLALPTAAFLIPSRTVEVARTPAAKSDTPAVVVPFFVNTAPVRVEPAVPTDRASVTSFGVSISALLTGAWALGAFVLLVPFLAGMWQTRSLRRSGSPWPSGDALVRVLSLDAGVRQRIDALLHASVPGPMTCGTIRPTILLPLDVETWSDEELRRALIHELEHVRRGDWASQCVARLVCIAYWFHPLVWRAWHRLCLEAERACDDAVLRRAEPAAYADQLVLLAERIATATTQPMLAMAACRDLPTRVRAVLDRAQTRGRAGALCVAAAIVTASVLVVGMAPLRAVAQGSPTDAAQGPALAFETASVKPNKSLDDERFLQVRPPSTFAATNMPLVPLVTFAYQIQVFQLQGAPDWAGAERFDILAKAAGEVALAPPASPRPDPLRMMMRTLLADRFKLVVHKETRELPIFELVLARRDGKPGPQLRPSTLDCAALVAARQAASRSGGPPPDLSRCGVTVNSGRIRMGGFPLSALANTLAPLTQRVVVDRTGLSGNWDVELSFTPNPGEPGSFVSPFGTVAPSADPGGPSLFTAFEEQLGLKLQPARGPVEVLVIDRVDRPTEN